MPASGIAYAPMPEEPSALIRPIITIATTANNVSAMTAIIKPVRIFAFARKEKELFKLLFMRDRSDEHSDTRDESIADIIALISRNTGLSEEEARLFHLEMWIFVHGIATMIVTNYLDWEEEYISRALTDAYEGLRTRWCGEAKGWMQ